MNPITEILSAIDRGDPQASQELLPLIYADLRRLAAQRLLHEKPGQTLQATALVHEAYLRLVGSGQRESTWECRAHFLSAAATAIRRILIERARYQQSLIHGGGRRREELTTDHLVAPEPDEKLLVLDSALQKFAEIDPDKARLVELRYFVGLTGDQAAEILGISPTTADRHWAFARAWLRREIQGGAPN